MTATAIPSDRPDGLALFLELTKFKISAASTFTAATGYIAIRRGVDLGLITALMGTLLLAMASSALNEVQERRLDALMERTRQFVGRLHRIARGRHAPPRGGGLVDVPPARGEQRGPRRRPYQHGRQPDLGLGHPDQ